MSAIERSETDSPSAATDRDESVLLEWTVHLMRRDPQRAGVVFAAMAFAALMGYLIFRSPIFSLAGIFMVFSATSEYILPTRYKLTSSRALASYGTARFEIPWSNVKRLLEAEGSVKLSPLKSAGRLDSFRGVLLRFAPDGEAADRADVMRIVENQLAEARTRA
jgi:hypothetical protein